jgi:hypothetical protein
MDQREIVRPGASYEVAFPLNRRKWLFGIETDKMVTNGGPQINLQKDPLLSKD